MTEPDLLIVFFLGMLAGVMATLPAFQSLTEQLYRLGWRNYHAKSQRT